jgi:hypothetical protein
VSTPTQEHAELEERARKLRRLDELGERLVAVISELGLHVGGADRRQLRRALHHVERARAHLRTRLLND